MAECSAFTKRGKRCTLTAKSSGLCWIHSKSEHSWSKKLTEKVLKAGHLSEAVKNIGEVVVGVWLTVAALLFGYHHPEIPPGPVQQPVTDVKPKLNDLPWRERVQRLWSKEMRPEITRGFADTPACEAGQVFRAEPRHADPVQPPLIQHPPGDARIQLLGSADESAGSAKGLISGYYIDEHLRRVPSVQAAPIILQPPPIPQAKPADSSQDIADVFPDKVSPDEKQNVG
jgi:hypothetical protein